MLKQASTKNASNNVQAPIKKTTKHETINNQHQRPNQRKCPKDQNGVKREWSESIKKCVCPVNLPMWNGK